MHRCVRGSKKNEYRARRSFHEEDTLRQSVDEDEDTGCKGAPVVSRRDA